jgi:hypothetical protein
MKFPGFILHENPLCGSRAVTCGQMAEQNTSMAKPTGAFLQLFIARLQSLIQVFYLSVVNMFKRLYERQPKTVRQVQEEKRQASGLSSLRMCSGPQRSRQVTRPTIHTGTQNRSQQMAAMVCGYACISCTSVN